MHGQAQAQVLEGAFEHKLITIFNTWSKIDVENKSVASKQLDPYVVLDQFITPLRSLCQSAPVHQASYAGIQNIRRFDVAFTNFDTMKRQYATIFSNYAESLGKLIPKIQNEFYTLLQCERYDRKFFTYILGPGPS
jgi:hypothetical protein